MSSPPAAEHEPPFADAGGTQCLGRLAGAAGELEVPGAWPGQQFAWLAEAKVLEWVIPRQFGGFDLPPRELIAGYIELARACLTTAFVLTQRNGACRRIADSENQALQFELLPRLGTGELFATVGISHLTTSRQHLSRPAVHAARSPDGFTLDGIVPWVTGATHADFIVTGGTLDDGSQILAAVPTALPGVEVRPPQQLLALNASQTGEVALRQVVLDERFLLFGPTPQVMKQGREGGAGSLGTSALALGLANSALDLLRTEAATRADLQEIVRPFQDEAAALQADLLATAGHSAEDRPEVKPEALRQRANSLVLRVTQASLAASKGAGFVRGHPAERHAREALFFLVWSCPQPVVAAALRELAFACPQ
jgi:alkylation response protein AidB-like acyl-CoA dehydrogenase